MSAFGCTSPPCPAQSVSTHRGESFIDGPEMLNVESEHFKVDTDGLSERALETGGHDSEGCRARFLSRVAATPRDNKVRGERNRRASFTRGLNRGSCGHGDPLVSVDTKKEVLVGDFKNAGREYQPAGHPERVNVHDFPDKDLVMPSRTASTTCPPAPAGSAWALTTTRPHSRSPP